MSYLHFFASLRDTVISIAVSGGYIALFVILFLEGIPLIGIAVPGHVAIISAGFLAATGVLSPAWVFILGVAGTILGDWMSFALGKKFGWPLIERFRPYFFISEATITRARTFLDNHTGKALVLGKFNPVTRGLLPFFIGANAAADKSGSHHKTFWIWNIVGATAWVTASVVGGYALGFGFHLLSGWTGKALVVAIIFGILIIWGYRFVNVRFHIFKKYELFILGLNVASLLVIFRMIEDAISPVSFLAGFDLYVNGVINTLVLTKIGPYMLQIAGWVSALGGTVMVIIFTLIGGVVLATHRKWRSAAILLLSVGATALVVGWLKDLIMRVRPENYVTIESPRILSILFDHPTILMEPSFPSAHAAFAAAFLVVITYLTVPKIRTWVRRELFILLTFTIGIGIGVSRLALSVHWGTDVIAGWAIGVFCATGSILLVRYLGELIHPHNRLGERTDR